jgi:hypothetical protein
MRRLSSVVLLSVSAAFAACSLVNAPEEVIAGSGGQTTTGSSGTCRVDSDCPTSDVPCTRYACVLGGACQLLTLVDGATCDDGKFCTVGDVCSAGKCEGVSRDCPGQDACNVGACNEAAKRCEVTHADGEPCDDGDPCTDDGVCSGGACTAGPDACAKLSNECSDGVCDPGVGCKTLNKLNGTGCGMSFCSNGTCKSGHCDITPINEGASCNDGLFCTVSDTCKGGYCVGDPNPCPTTGPCVKGVCDEEADKCVTKIIADNSPCDDNDACTANEFCSSNQCIGGLPPTTLFSEDFASNAQGWLLGPEWQIGHTTLSFGQQFGNPDPLFDVTSEGNVAGVALGGTAKVAMGDPTHEPYYLTSPPVDTMLAGAIYLTFYRWLNSDFTPYMKNTIEVSTDGAAWTVIWETFEVPVTDSAWTFQAFDISAFKSKTTRFRFGFSIGASNVYRVSGWNLDKVKVQNAPCPN